ncbi:glutathionylspermidine synthase family protein [Corticimicrobacter populi]|uniref:Glutathionylspermidine synthase pre-ATP-grasp-like domain-containing protein n=1 Tax=Corticimicrobacter populi TaxID=2175229 RepID=A0A2V1JZV8_9BURK|nr:glutathionylspermidine synthase family protein [Corticimicrobacter populi]PWF22974.1 hypothetical protein DD235_08150 [Corticimicrobacter populi]
MTAAITARTYSIDFDAAALLSQELPLTHLFYTDHGQLNSELADLFSFPIAHQAAMPFYLLPEPTADEMASTLTLYYAMMVDAVRILLSSPNARIRRYFDCDMMQAHGDMFIDYARATLHSPGLAAQTLYGRFDAAVDPASGRITGIYEFNGNTPVMLFESVNLENILATGLGHPQRQFNEWWHTTIAMLQTRMTGGKRVAVVCDTSFIEDITTCETLVQLFEAAGCDPYLVDIRELDYDYLMPEQPFIMNQAGLRPDLIFMLTPWEEMVMTFPEAFRSHRKWFGQVSFMEPAWRWFLSHKGILVFISDLYDSDQAFATRHAGLPHLRAAFEAETIGPTHVAKPALGRLSSNIRIIEQGTLTAASGGSYQDTPMIYQAYCPPGQVAGRNNFILGAWMTSRPNSLLGDVSTLCFREFDQPVLDLRNERFIPHLLTPLD